MILAADAETVPIFEIIARVLQFSLALHFIVLGLYLYRRSPKAGADGSVTGRDSGRLIAYILLVMGAFLLYHGLKETRVIGRGTSWLEATVEIPMLVWGVAMVFLLRQAWRQRSESTPLQKPPGNGVPKGERQE